MPLRRGPRPERPHPPPLDGASDRRSVVLVVDEEPQLHKLYRLVLERNGYRVLTTRSSQHALTLSRTFPERIDLILSDMDMDGMSGLELAHQMAAERHGIAVLITSGNLAHASECEFPFLAKPFSLDDLLTAAAAAMAAPASVDDILKQHIPEEDLEDYARRALPKQEFEQHEQHLLVCPDCREALEKTEAYVSAMQTAASQLASLPVRRKFQQQPLLRAAPIWAIAAAILVGIVSLGIYQMTNHPVAPQSVNLQALRGRGSEIRAQAGIPLRLHLDTSGLPPDDSYRIELVNDSGREIWSKIETARNSEVLTTSGALATGFYLVRVYSPSRQLLREYALQVSKKP